MEFCAEDECVEVTPEVVRVRKVELDATTRARSRSRAKAALSAADTLNSVPATRRIVVALFALMMVVSSCTGQPPPAPQSTDTSRSTLPPPPRATQIIMAIDSIGPGFTRICCPISHR